MSTHLSRTGPGGTLGAAKRLLAIVFVATLLPALPCDVLAEDADNGSGTGRLGNAGRDGGLSHMSNARPDAGAPVLPSFGGDPFAAESPDAAPADVGTRAVDAQDKTATDDMPDTGLPRAEKGSGQEESGVLPGTAEAPEVPNFGALPDMAGTDRASEERERLDRNDPGRDTDGRERDTRGREPLSRANRNDGADKARERPDRGDALAIPEGAARSGDTRFLAGCWRSETALRRTGTGVPLRIEYCFDENGNGRRIHAEDNNRCEGPVTAAFRGRTLVIEGGEIPCADGSTYSPSTVECDEVDGKTICRGKEAKPDGGHNLWDARFRKSS